MTIEGKIDFKREIGNKKLLCLFNTERLMRTKRECQGMEKRVFKHVNQRVKKNKKIFPLFLLSLPSYNFFVKFWKAKEKIGIVTGKFVQHVQCLLLIYHKNKTDDLGSSDEHIEMYIKTLDR